MNLAYPEHELDACVRDDCKCIWFGQITVILKCLGKHNKPAGASASPKEQTCPLQYG